MKNYIRRLRIICNEKGKTVSLLRSDHGHDESDALYQLAWTEFRTCLKCGEEHLTKDCPIKQRLETKFCINCQVYGHMANWHGCPCFPKPPKGAAKKLIKTHTRIYTTAF
ncbi:hypothetical protein TNCV_3117131 [Trichonephila clavipes]|nr:hypothetical protein TNCV_3117131 [Trichonephila clavipes]